MTYVDMFAGLIVSWLPVGWQVSPTNVALLLWAALWVVGMTVFFWLVFNLLAKKETMPEVKHNTSFD